MNREVGVDVPSANIAIEEAERIHQSAALQ